MTSQTLSNVPAVHANFKSSVSTAESKQKKKRRSPLSVRMSDEQWKQFEQDAIGMSLNAYALSCFFDKSAKAKGKQTKRDKAVATALRRMGGLGLGTFIASQILAYEEGRIVLTRDEIRDLRKADAEFYMLRRDLLQALGMKAYYKE